MHKATVPLRILAAGMLCLSAAAACNSGDGNFSQYPGFAEHFAAFPPRDGLPAPAERSLLDRHRPRLYLAPGQPPPIDFYRDYVAQGVLMDGAGNTLAEAVDQALLNRHRDDSQAVFVHLPREPAGTPSALGRLASVDVTFADATERLTFLTYHFVFRHSGLPAALPFWQEAGLALAGDLEDWHQLDHYTAATIVLDAAERPLALMLQQHNYLRTYLYGVELPRPADGRPAIDAALRSNELYPHSGQRTRHRAVRFLDAEAFRFMLGFGVRPLASADDITDGQQEVAYELDFLPPNDAFYSFKGFLGERRQLPGRSGPPGADYNTLPPLKPLPLQLFAGYWRPGHAPDLERFEQSGADRLAFARVQKRVFRANWLCLRRGREGCAIDAPRGGRL